MANKQIVKRATRAAKTNGKGKAPKAKRTAATQYAPTAKIRIVAKANPFRVNSSRYTAFASLRNGVTVAQAITGKGFGKYGVQRVRLFAHKGLIAVQ